MTLEVNELGLLRTGLPLLRDLVHDRTGLAFDNDRMDSLVTSLAPLVIEHGFKSYLELYYLLKYDDPPEDWNRVIDALVVPETYFWREIDQIRAVVCHVIPKLVASSRGLPIRIWSVPCASGEEPLTIAMMLAEAGWFARAPIEIYASDASQASLARARAGVYRERSFRSLPADLREKYFVRSDGGSRPVPVLRDRITAWTQVNLVDRWAAGTYSSAPIIFCRNAFIYFSPAVIKRIVEGFAAAMPSPGYLCIGASESLLNVTTAFMLEDIDGAFVYVKH